MNRHTQALEESLASILADLDAAREKGAYTAVGTMQRLAYKIRTEIAAAHAAEDDDELSDEQIAEALADGILALPDESLPAVAAALEQRRRNGRK